MRLQTVDQVHISAISATTLPAGHEFDVHDTIGAELLHKLPHVLRPAAADEKAEASPANKAEPAPVNKAHPAPANKSAGKKRPAGE